MNWLTIIKSPWTLLIIACVAGMGGTGWYRMEYLGEAAARAADKAKQADAVNTANAKAESLANELIIAQAAAMAVTTKTATVYVDRIRNVTTPDTACARDPRMQLGSHGVHDLVLGMVPAAQTGGADAGVRGPRAGARP